jgi:GNAT superfamily N-acetyltransferase
MLDHLQYQSTRVRAMLLRMNAAEFAVAADDNLAATWAMLGRSIGADVAESGPLTLVAIGIPLAFFNGAFVRASTDEPERLVAEAIDFFAQRELPWLLWVRENVATALLDAGRRLGLRDAGGPPGMGLDPIPECPPPPPELTIEIATTAEALVDHASMLRDGFGMPQHVVDRLIRPGLLDEPRAAAFVGRVDGTPVSSSLLAVTGPTAGVYNVATPEPFRGKGYGAALTWAAIAEGARRGCTHAVLQASPSGYPVYQRMGFTDIGRYVQLEGPPHASA